MGIYGIETGYYMGESYQERLNQITDYDLFREKCESITFYENM